MAVARCKCITTQVQAAGYRANIIGRKHKVVKLVGEGAESAAVIGMADQYGCLLLGITMDHRPSIVGVFITPVEERIHMDCVPMEAIIQGSLHYSLALRIAHQPITKTTCNEPQCRN